MATHFPPKGDADKRAGAELAPLQVTAQENPNMTVRVRAGSYFNSLNTYVEYAGGNTAVLVPPVSGAVWALILLNDSGSLQVDYGAASTTPSFPPVPDAHLPLAAVYLPAATTSITGSMVCDVRPFLRSDIVVPNLVAELNDRPTFNDMNNALALKADVGSGGGAGPHTHTTADITNFSAAVGALIAGKADVATTLAGYGIADAYTKTQTDALLAPLATSAAVTSSLALKADAADLANYATVASVALKADAADLANYATVASVALKADATALAGYATTSALALKADASSLANYATTSALSLKADASDLALKADATHTHVVGDVTGLTAALAGKANVVHSHTAADLPAQPYDLYFQVDGQPSASAVVFRFKSPRGLTIQTTGHTSMAETPIVAAETAVFDIQLNGASVGTLTFSDVNANGVVSIASPVSVVAGDVIRVVAPATPNAVLADLAVTLVAVVA